jgi:hypothetical protein
MQVTLEYRNKVVAKFPRSALKKKNKIEEGGALGSRVKKKQESIEAQAQKMIRGRVAPSIVPLVLIGR